MPPPLHGLTSSFEPWSHTPSTRLLAWPNCRSKRHVEPNELVWSIRIFVFKLKEEKVRMRDWSFKAHYTEALYERMNAKPPPIFHTND